MTYNRITAEIGESRRITTRPISYQYDTVQILMLTAAEGVELPEFYQVDFCVIGDEDTVTMVGSLSGGAPIPDSLLRQGENLMAYLVLTGTESDVQTRYEITIPVNERPTRSGIELSDDQQAQVDSLVEALNEGVDRAEAAAEAIQDMGVEAETLAPGSPLTVTKEVDPETGAVTLIFGLTQGPKGDDGYSPTITITEITGGHRFTVTDAIHPSGQSFDVLDGTKGDKGDDGYSPTITITTITGGHRFTVTDKTHPSGQSFDVLDGAKGDQGDDGYSPVVTITTITGGHRVTITDKTHPSGQSFDVMDGASDAGQVSYDPTQTYPDGSVGKEVSNQKNAISQLEMQSLTEDAKTALINCFSHVAWIDQHGQDYIDALVASFKTVTSISAVFTQGANRIYNNDTLDDLKQYLVVTATYNDASTDVLADADYTLSGVLTAGTSTITVTYKNKTDTFDVVVTAVLYPLENGTHLFTANDRVLTVTNGSHFRYEAPNATASSTPKGAYLNLSTVSENNTSATESSNIRIPSDTLFTFLAGSTAVFEVKNIHLTNKTTSTANNQYNIGFRDPTATEAALQIGDHYNNTTADITVSKTFNADASITCIYAYFRNQYSSYEADIHLTVDGIRWF